LPADDALVMFVVRPQPHQQSGNVQQVDHRFMQNRWGEHPREPKLKIQNGSSGASPHHCSWELIHQFASLGHRDAFAGSRN
jgi:hypothetical protein